jgi:hypothetical protein
VFAGALVAALAQAGPARAYNFTFTVTKLPICNPSIHVGSWCSLSLHAVNVGPPVPLPFLVRVQLNTGTSLFAAVAVGSAWTCPIIGGQFVRCTYLGPKPVPTGFQLPSITVRVRAKPIIGPFLWAPVCGDVAAYLGSVPQPFMASGCTTVVIVP